jgi:hypothetical protein
MKRAIKGFVGWLLAAGFVWLSATAGGCGGGSPVAAVCNKLCECEPTYCEGPGDVVGQCVEDGEAARDEAIEMGCGSQFDDFYGCLAAGSTPCSGPTNPCLSQLEAFDTCITPDPGPCQPYVDQIVAKLEGCGVEHGWSDFECAEGEVERLECQVPCYDTTCEALDGTDMAGNEAVEDCVIACSQ